MELDRTHTHTQRYTLTHSDKPRNLVTGETKQHIDKRLRNREGNKIEIEKETKYHSTELEGCDRKSYSLEKL